MARKPSAFQEQIDRRIWRRVRFRVLLRDGWTCRRCGRWGNQCDHVKPLFEGGQPYAMGNLQILCSTCHWDKSRSEQVQPEPPDTREWTAYLKDVILPILNIT